MYGLDGLSVGTPHKKIKKINPKNNIYIYITFLTTNIHVDWINYIVLIVIYLCISNINYRVRLIGVFKIIDNN